MKFRNKLADTCDCFFALIVQACCFACQLSYNSTDWQRFVLLVVSLPPEVMPGKNYVSPKYKQKLAYFVEEEEARASLKANEYSGVRKIAESINETLKEMGMLDGEVGISSTIVHRWRKQEIRTPPAEGTLKAVALVRGVTLGQLLGWLEDDETPVDAVPWSSDYKITPEVINSLKKSFELEAPKNAPRKTTSARVSAQKRQNAAHVTEVIQEASDREIADAAPVFLDRLFSGAKVFITILPADAEIAEEKIRELADLRFSVLGNDQSDHGSRAKNMTTNMGNGQVMAYVCDLFSDSGRNLEDPLDLEDLTRRIELGLGDDPAKKREAIDTIKRVLTGVDARFEGEDENLLFAVASGLNQLLRFNEVTADYLQDLNTGKVVYVSRERCDGAS